MQVLDELRRKRSRGLTTRDDTNDVGAKRAAGRRVALGIVVAIDALECSERRADLGAMGIAARQRERLAQERELASERYVLGARSNGRP